MTLQQFYDQPEEVLLPLITSKAEDCLLSEQEEIEINDVYSLRLTYDDGMFGGWEYIDIVLEKNGETRDSEQEDQLGTTMRTVYDRVMDMIAAELDDN